MRSTFPLAPPVLKDDKVEEAIDSLYIVLPFIISTLSSKVIVVKNAFNTDEKGAIEQYHLISKTLLFICLKFLKSFFINVTDCI